MLYSHIFIDGSVNNQLKFGYGAYLVVSELVISLKSPENTVKVRRFEQTNSTRLELQTLLWALEETNALANDHELALTVYTDSQNFSKKSAFISPIRHPKSQDKRVSQPDRQPDWREQA